MGVLARLIVSAFISKYLWWNALAQVERFQDCSGKNTYYRYDERQHLVAVTDALNQTTTLERKPDGEVLRIQHPDGSAESFTYNALGQVLTHTDGKGQTTRLLRTARGLPSSRQDAKGQRIRYEYDQAIRLTALVNENNAAYQFAYDTSDRLIEEKRIDNLTRQFSYNLGGHLTRVNEIGYGERGERPQRHTEFERDAIGRLLAKLNADARQGYTYDDADRLLTIERLPTANGKKLGVSEEKLDFAYDLLGRLRMLREETPGQSSLYVYEPGSYAPLARVEQEEGGEQTLYYFHTDQIGTPLEMTDREGQIVWQATYKAWGTVVFLDGNPDRPLIMGSLYNSKNTPPWSLPANKTQSGFLTRSIKGKGNNANFFRFEDKTGAEQISLHAERNLDTEIEADESHTVGGNREIKVDGKHTETIKLETSIAVTEGSYYVTVDSGEVKINAATSITLEVGASKLVMKADGTITLSGVNIDVIGSTKINLN
jgi:YD repeat-containing protein